MMKSRLITLTGTLSILATMVACSSSDDNPSEPAARYIGSWATACVPSLLPNVEGSFFSYRFQFGEEEWNFRQSGYLDDACTQQMSGTAETGLRERGTLTTTASYVDTGTTTSSDGLLSNNLTSTVTAFDNTLDETGDEAAAAIGTSVDLLVFVNDTNMLFVDGAFLGVSDTPGSLLLTLPFTQAVE